MNDQGAGGARLLRSDAGIAFLLLNEARHRILVRLFGISRNDSSFVTVIGIGIAGAVLCQKMARLRRLASRPSASSTLIGAATLNEAAHRIAGESSRRTPFLGGLITFALVGRYHSVVSRSIRGAIASVRRIRNTYWG